MNRFTDSQRSVLLALAVLTGTVVVVVGIMGVVRFAGDDAPTTTNAPVAASTTSVTPTVTTTTILTTTTTILITTTTFGVDSLVMTPTGLGPLALGSPIGPALDTVRSVLGEPDEDTDWIDSFSGFGTCPGTRVRVVRWQSLQLYFSDGPTEWGPAGTDHLFTYTNSALLAEPLPLRTDLGVMVGSTVADLIDAYGTGAGIFDDEILGPLFVVDPADAPYLWGGLDGVGEGGRVLSINGGTGCGE